MDHSYEEIRSVTLDLLAKREILPYEISQYGALMSAVALIFHRRENADAHNDTDTKIALSRPDADTFLEVFWSLFREGVITLGRNDARKEFPYFHVSGFGRRLLEGENAYFFHDVSSYEREIISQVPEIDSVTLIYLKEAMQAFKSGCILSSTVMLGVATEHSFLVLVDKIAQNPVHATTFANVGQQRTILQKVNKFKNILDQQLGILPTDVKEDLDTNFSGILSIIRTFRNQSGHPTGKIIDREQAYILLQLFIPYCKKIYQLIAYYS